MPLHTTSESFLAYWLMPLFCAFPSQSKDLGDMCMTLVPFELAISQCELRMYLEVLMRSSRGGVKRG